MAISMPLDINSRWTRTTGAAGASRVTYLAFLFTCSPTTLLSVLSLWRLQPNCTAALLAASGEERRTYICGVDCS